MRAGWPVICPHPAIYGGLGLEPGPDPVAGNIVVSVLTLLFLGSWVRTQSGSGGGNLEVSAFLLLILGS